MTIYTPNIKDPRVLKRIKHAYGYARGVFSETKEQQKSIQALSKQFGQMQDSLAQFLYSTLLTCTDHYYNESAGISKKYILNADGAAKIREILKGNPVVVFTVNELKLLPPNPSARCIDEIVVNSFIEREYGDELARLDFKYVDKSNRYWHELQNVRSLFRGKILAKHGLKYNYDICACAPTLLMQHAQQQNGLCFTEIEDFIDNRSAYRQYITDECELTPEYGYDIEPKDKNKTAKTIINSLFCGARLGLNAGYQLSRLLDYDAARILAAKELTVDLRKDIKNMWDEITPTMSRKRSPKGRLIAIQSSDKWIRYFQIEREVINAVRVYLDKTDNKYFLEHDGWSCEKIINEEELLAFIYKMTGYKVSVDYDVSDDSMINGDDDSMINGDIIDDN